MAAMLLTNNFGIQEDFRPKRPTEEEKQEMLLKIARSKRAGPPVDKELCGLKDSNHDLDPDSGKR